MSTVLLLRPRVATPSQVAAPVPGVVITLDWAWLHTAPNYADRIELTGTTTVDIEDDTLSETRTYAAGNTALVTRPGQIESMAVTLSGISIDDYADLKRREGTVQMWRDPHGRVLHGSYNDLKGKDWVTNELMDASFTFRCVDWPETD